MHTQRELGDGVYLPSSRCRRVVCGRGRLQNGVETQSSGSWTRPGDGSENNGWLNDALLNLNTILISNQGIHQACYEIILHCTLWCGKTSKFTPLYLLLQFLQTNELVTLALQKPTFLFKKEGVVNNSGPDGKECDEFRPWLVQECCEIDRHNDVVDITWSDANWCTLTILACGT